MIKVVRRGAAIAGLCLALAAAQTAAAQDSISGGAPVAHFTPAQAGAFSKQIEQDLASRGARVAMVFRTGRPRNKMPKGIAYTHGAFWVYRDIKTADGATVPGYAVYNLYAGDGKAWPVSQSRLVQDFPLDFTRGSAEDDVAIIVPSPEMQRRLLLLIDSPTYQTLHNPAYGLVANPWRSKYQNCNDFMLDLVAAAAWDTHDPDQILADLQAHYVPAIVEADPLTRFFGPMVDARLRIDDQSGPIRTATYESMAAFMRDSALLEAAYSVSFRREAAAG
jgi:hypothetical protein